MQRIILLFCIMCNFFSLYIMETFGFGLGLPSFANGILTEKMLHETAIELSLLFSIMLFIAIVVPRPRRKLIQSQEDFSIDHKGKYYKYFYFLFCFFLFYIFVFCINWSFDNSSRGEGQFEVSNRPSFFHLFVYELYLPFMLYLYIIGFFKKRFYLFVTAALVFLIKGVSDGGRDVVVLSSLVVILYVSYYKKLDARHYIGLFSFVLLFLSLSARDRFNEDNSFLESIVVKIIQCNSESYFIPLVKQAIKDGTELSPLIFSFHFLSIVFPSFLINSFFGLLSYPRSSFIFNTIYNEGNETTGYGFMLLADFYWCFGYIGYFLYLCVFWHIIKYFSKNIYSSNPSKIVLSIMMTVYFCNQREDFGNFLKPTVYTLIFLSLLEFFRKKNNTSYKIRL